MINGIIKTRAINKGCLQKLHLQTHHKNPCYRPHVQIRDPYTKNFILAEEHKIDNRYNHKKSDSVVSLEKRQEQSIADGRCVGANRINKDPQGFSRITFIGTVDSCHQVMIPKALPV